MAYSPGAYDLVDPNMSMYRDQYPALLPKNIRGIARIWDRAFPDVTERLFPSQSVPFHFQDQIYIEPAEMAPYVAEGAPTPVSDAGMKWEAFICREARWGFKIHERQLNEGVKGILQKRIVQITTACKLRRQWQAIQTLQGINVNQPLTLRRLNTFAAQNIWTDPINANIIRDTLRGKKYIEQMTGEEATDMWVGFDEWEAIHENADILDQLRYTDKTLLVNGRITVLKGLRVNVVRGFYKQATGIVGEGNINEERGYGEGSGLGSASQKKVFLLTNKCIITSGVVGYMGQNEPRGGSSPIVRNWFDYNTRSIWHQAFLTFVPVVEDYGRICVITGTITA